MGHTEVFDIPRSPYYTTGGPFLPNYPKGWAKKAAIILPLTFGFTFWAFWAMCQEPYRKTYTAPYAAHVIKARKEGNSGHH